MKFVNSKLYLFLRNSRMVGILRPIWRYFYMFIYSPRKLKQYADDMLAIAVKIMDKEDVCYWIDFGTLLGAIRNHDFIAYDGDIDIAVLHTEAEKLVPALKACEDFDVTHEYWVNGKIAQISCEYHSLNMDFCFYYPEAKEPYNYCCYLCSFEESISKNIKDNKYPVSVIQSSIPYKGVKKYDFKGLIVNIPQNEVEYLVANYGENYMVPNKKWDYLNDAPNIYKYPVTELQGTCILNK